MWRRLLVVALLICWPGVAWSRRPRGRRIQSPNPADVRITALFPHLTYDEGYKDLFGEPNIQKLENGTHVSISMNRHTGSGFVSREKYHYGFFSAAMKLPSSYTAGVVVAFYMSNADVFPRTHDEIDFELLGHDTRGQWVLQTNIYGNGSVSTGREEKFNLWFDASQDFHEYSILWNDHHTLFLVDNIPIREVNHNAAMSRAYPLKPMSVYATIWDGSDWATHGGKSPVNYAYAPFVASFGALEMEGCVWNRTDSASPCTGRGGQGQQHLGLDPVEGPDFVRLSDRQRSGMEWVRGNFMTYSYCKDRNRYKVLPPEC